MMKFCSVASGSSGNSYIIASEETTLVLDAGVSCKRILAGLEAAGRCVGDVSGILITHEHSDHIRSLKALSRKAENAAIYATNGSFEAMRQYGALYEGAEEYEVSAGELFTIGDIEALCFPLSHDAEEPCGYRFECKGSVLSVVTDTGIITEEIFRAVADSGLLVLEANYEEEMLLTGRYPYFLKQRIKGDYGHLSNVAAAETIVRILEAVEGLHTVLLAHLSQENNHPALAYETVRSYLSDHKIEIGRDLMLETLERSSMSEVYYVL